MDAKNLADSLALTLLGLGTHTSGIGGLGGMGEITLRDSLVAACAAEGARRNKAWIFAREQTPMGWLDEAIDVVVQRVVRNSIKWINAVELKWWRDSTCSNASNRRTALVRDIMRCASVHYMPGVEDKSLVVLVSTKSSWDATTSTTGGDLEVCKRLKSTTGELWPIRRGLYSCPAVKAALKSLVRPAKTTKGKPPVPKALRLPPPSSLRTKLLGKYESDIGGGDKLQARIWQATKVQRSQVLTLADVEALTK